MAESMESMILDQDLFYESIHVRILSALVSCATPEDAEQVDVQYVGERGHLYDFLGIQKTSLKQILSVCSQKGLMAPFWLPQEVLVEEEAFEGLMVWYVNYLETAKPVVKVSKKKLVEVHPDLQIESEVSVAGVEEPKAIDVEQEKEKSEVKKEEIAKKGRETAYSTKVQDKEPLQIEEKPEITSFSLSHHKRLARQYNSCSNLAGIRKKEGMRASLSSEVFRGMITPKYMRRNTSMVKLDPIVKDTTSGQEKEILQEPVVAQLHKHSLLEESDAKESDAREKTVVLLEGQEVAEEQATQEMEEETASTEESKLIRETEAISEKEDHDSPGEFGSGEEEIKPLEREEEEQTETIQKTQTILTHLESHSVFEPVSEEETPVNESSVSERHQELEEEGVEEEGDKEIQRNEDKEDIHEEAKENELRKTMKMLFASISSTFNEKEPQGEETPESVESTVEEAKINVLDEWNSLDKSINADVVSVDPLACIEPVEDSDADGSTGLEEASLQKEEERKEDDMADQKDENESEKEDEILENGKLEKEATESDQDKPPVDEAGSKEPPAILRREDAQMDLFFSEMDEVESQNIFLPANQKSRPVSRFTQSLLESQELYESCMQLLDSLSSDEEENKEGHVAQESVTAKEEEEDLEAIAPAAEPYLKQKSSFFMIPLDDQKPKVSIQINLQKNPRRRLNLTPKRPPSEQVEQQEQEKQGKRRENEELAKRQLAMKKREDTPKKIVAKSAIKPQSNKTLVRNALMHVCLAGQVNEGLKKEVIQVPFVFDSKELDESPATHFIILFRGRKNHLFRGLYSYDPELDQVLKVYAGTQGPDVLETEKVIEYYKYDTGSRSFKPIPTRTFGRSVHAVAIGVEAVKFIKRTHKMHEKTSIKN